MDVDTTAFDDGEGEGFRFEEGEMEVYSHFFIAYLHHVLAYLDEIGRKKCDVTWYPPS
jgi:hypothetical protein